MFFSLQANGYSTQLSSSSSSSYWYSITVVVYLEADKKSNTAEIIGGWIEGYASMRLYNWGWIEGINWYYLYQQDTFTFR